MRTLLHPALPSVASLRRRAERAGTPDGATLEVATPEQAMLVEQAAPGRATPER